MNDIELIRAVMDVQRWSQADVARYLGVGRASITKILKYGQALHPASRKLLNMLLEEKGYFDESNDSEEYY